MKIGNDDSLPDCWMLWNFLEDSREFYRPGDRYKSRSHPRRRREELPTSRVEQFLQQFLVKNSESGFLSVEFEMWQQFARKNTRDISQFSALPSIAVTSQKCLKIPVGIVKIKEFHMITSYLQKMTFLTSGIQSLQHRWKKLWTARESMFKNKPHSVILNISILVSLWTFQPSLEYTFTHTHTHTHTHIYIYMNECACACVCVFNPQRTDTNMQGNRLFCLLCFGFKDDVFNPYCRK